MDHAPPQDTQQSKGSVSRHQEHSDESLDKRTTDGSVSPSQDDKRVIRRVRSPSRPRAWLSSSYKPKTVPERYYKPSFRREDHGFYKPGFSSQRYHYFNHHTPFYRRDYVSLKHPHGGLWERDRERYKRRDSADGGSPPPKLHPTRPFLPRSSSSRDKDTQYNVSPGDRSQSRERDHGGARSREREWSRDRDMDSGVSQAVARDRAIQRKRKEIDEVYYQECEMFGLVTKMLIAKDQSLERPIQSSLQENLRDIGKRCVEAMEKFIEDYDSRESSH